MKTKILLITEDKLFGAALTKELNKTSFHVVGPGRDGVIQAVFDEVPHLIILDEEYENGRGKRFALELKQDVVLK